MRALIFIILVVLPSIAFTAPISYPTETEVKGIERLCSGGRSYGFTANANISLKKWREGTGKATVNAALQDLGAVFAQIKVEENEVKIFEIYTKCVGDRIDQLIKASQKEDHSALDSKQPVWAWHVPWEPCPKDPKIPIYLCVEPWQLRNGKLLVLHRTKIRVDRKCVPGKTTIDDADYCPKGGYQMTWNFRSPPSDQILDGISACAGNPDYLAVQNEMNESWTKNWSGRNDKLKFQGKLLDTIQSCVQAKSSLPERFSKRIEIVLRDRYVKSSEDDFQALGWVCGC